MSLLRIEAHFAVVLRNLPRLGSKDDSSPQGSQNPSLRERLTDQTVLLKTQAKEECSSDQNLSAFVKLADAALAVFSVPVGESYAVKLAILEALIQEYSSKSESFLEILRI
jgi:hypothetical protein